MGKNPRLEGFSALHAPTRRRFIAGAAGLALALPALMRPGQAQAAFVADRSLKLGFIVPLTGPIAAEGESMRRGLELGIAAVNASGGIGGKPVELIMQDNQSQPAMAATIAKKFIEQEKVDIIIGTVTFDEATVVEKLATRAGIPFVTLENGYYVAEGTPSMTCGAATMISFGENVAQMIDPLVEYFTRGGGGKWALVGNEFQFPRDYLGYARRKAEPKGVTIEIEEYAPIGTADWSSTVSKIKAAQPDLILSAVVGGDAIAFVKTAESMGLLPATKFTGVSLLPELYPAFGGAVDGQIAITHYAPDLRNAQNDAFKAAYAAAYGEEIIPAITSMTYDSLAFIKAAAEKAGSYEPAKFLAAFDGIEAMTVFSDKPVRMQPEVRAIDYPMFACRIEPGGNWAIVEELGVVPNQLSC
jgi:ABC-type branched-subunit amino acid transport system substrate-binding protein